MDFMTKYFRKLGKNKDVSEKCTWIYSNNVSWLLIRTLGDKSFNWFKENIYKSKWAYVNLPLIVTLKITWPWTLYSISNKAGNVSDHLENIGNEPKNFLKIFPSFHILSSMLLHLLSEPSINLALSHPTAFTFVRNVLSLCPLILFLLNFHLSLKDRLKYHHFQETFSKMFSQTA